MENTVSGVIHTVHYIRTTSKAGKQYNKVQGKFISNKPDQVNEEEWYFVVFSKDDRYVFPKEDGNYKVEVDQVILLENKKDSLGMKTLLLKGLIK